MVLNSCQLLYLILSITAVAAIQTAKHCSFEDCFDVKFQGKPALREELKERFREELRLVLVEPGDGKPNVVNRGRQATTTVSYQNTACTGKKPAIKLEHSVGEDSVTLRIQGEDVWLVHTESYSNYRSDARTKLPKGKANHIEAITGDVTIEVTCLKDSQQLCRTPEGFKPKCSIKNVEAETHYEYNAGSAPFGWVSNRIGGLFGKSQTQPSAPSCETKRPTPIGWSAADEEYSCQKLTAYAQRLTNYAIHVALDLEKGIRRREQSDYEWLWAETKRVIGESIVGQKLSQALDAALKQYNAAMDSQTMKNVRHFLQKSKREMCYRAAQGKAQLTQFVQQTKTQISQSKFANAAKPVFDQFLTGSNQVLSTLLNWSAQVASSLKPVLDNAAQAALNKIGQQNVEKVKDFLGNAKEQLMENAKKGKVSLDAYIRQTKEKFVQSEFGQQSSAAFEKLVAVSHSALQKVANEASTMGCGSEESQEHGTQKDPTS